MIYFRHNLLEFPKKAKSKLRSIIRSNIHSNNKPIKNKKFGQENKKCNLVVESDK